MPNPVDRLKTARRPVHNPVRGGERFPREIEIAAREESSRGRGCASKANEPNGSSPSGSSSSLPQEPDERVTPEGAECLPAVPR
jgi:hypothetical protein